MTPAVHDRTVPPAAEPIGPAGPWTIAHVGLIALPAGAIGAWSIWLAVAGHIAPWLAVVAHLLTAGVLAGVARAARDAHRARALWLLAVGVGGLGPMGAAGAVLAVGLGRWFDRRATPIDEWRRALFPEGEVDKDEALWALVGVRQSDQRAGIAPFVDVLEHGALAQKQAVVALIARHFRPAFAPALRLALKDPQNAVRVQAATAVSLIEAGATSSALELERQRRERPGDLALLRELARHEDQYAFTGLLDAAREQESRTRAIEAFRAYLAARPDDAGAWHELGRLFARLGQYDEALPCLREALRLGGGVETRLWTMECLFHLRRFADLRVLASESAAAMAAERQALPAQTPQMLRLWAPGARGAS